jgi:hypothetical protein
MSTLKERMTELMLQRRTAAEMEEFVVKGLKPFYDAFQNDERSPEIIRKMRVYMSSKSDAKNWRQEAEDLEALIKLIPESET